MGKGAILMGVAFILFGIWLLFKAPSEWYVLIYPLGCIAIGIALIILNKEEEKIEQRKDLKEKKAK